MGKPGDRTAGVILAGGLARRMGGGDKGLIALGGMPLLQHVITRLAPQVDVMIVNANGDGKRFAQFGLPVVPDPVPDAAGPLAGVLAGLDWASRQSPAIGQIVTVASDTPFFPVDLVEVLMIACRKNRADLACAASNGRAHPVFGIWPTALREDLHKAVTEEQVRKVDAWTGRHGCVHAEFATGTLDPFFNINRPEDLERAGQHFERTGA